MFQLYLDAQVFEDYFSGFFDDTAGFCEGGQGIREESIYFYGKFGL
jgi:hypothetical protein